VKNKNTAANIVLAKCGANSKVELFVIFIHRCFSIPHFFYNLVQLKKHRLRLVEN